MNNTEPAETGPPTLPGATGSSEPVPAKPSQAEPEQQKKLTPEEQMALYEENLKENDWGHQPC